MKIAITAIDKGLSVKVDLRFGRARYFAIYDTETKQIEWVNNCINLNSTQGAGIQTAQNMIEHDISAVITGNLGPKAFRVLCAGDITSFECEDSSVEEAIRLFEENKLNQMLQANVEGHW